MAYACVIQLPANGGPNVAYDLGANEYSHVVPVRVICLGLGVIQINQRIRFPV